LSQHYDGERLFNNLLYLTCLKSYNNDYCNFLNRDVTDKHQLLLPNYGLKQSHFLPHYLVEMAYF